MIEATKADSESSSVIIGALEEKDDGTNLNREYPKGFRLAAIFVALVLSIFLVSLDMTIVATAIPRITDDFHSLTEVGWYGSAFFLTLASFQSTWGKAYKYFPLKPSFLIAIAIFELGSLICGVARNNTTFIVGRAVAGMGGAGIASGAYTIIAFAATPDQRPAFTGVLGATYGCASVVGPLLGGLFTDKVSWRWCFYVNLPIGAVPAQASFKEKVLQMDLLGTFTIMASVVCYLLALQWGGVSRAWSSSSVIGTLVGFVLLAVSFVIIEWRMGDRALLLPRLLRQRTVLLACFFTFLLAGGFFLLMYFLPIYFQAIGGVSAVQSGIRNLPLILGVSLFTILSGNLISAFGHFVPMLVAGASLATIGSGLLFTLTIGSSSSHWIGFQALAGIGIGLSIQVPIIAAQAKVEPSDISLVTAMVLFFQTIGGAFFVSAGQSVFANGLIQTLPSNAPDIDETSVLLTGATELRSTFPAGSIAGILRSYMDGLQSTYAIAIALMGSAAVVSLLVEWRNIRGNVGSGAV